MADSTRTVEFVFFGKDEVSKTIKNIGNSLSGIEQAAAPFAGIADGILKVDAALAALAAGGVALAIKRFADFEDVLLKVKGISGANAKEYAALKEQTLALGESTRFTAKEAAEGLQFLTQAGIDLVTSQKALPDVLNLSSASATDLGRTADIVTNIMAGFGIEAEGLAKSSDILVSTFTGANVNLDQLGASFKFVGPVAKSLGISFEETSAALGLLGNAGYQAEMGGTALRNILLALVAPTTNMGALLGKLGVSNEEFGVNLVDSRNALKSLGIEVKGTDGRLKPLSQILIELNKSLEGIESPADRAATAINIFGKRGGPQLLALLEQGAPAFEKMKTRLSESEGLTKRLADEMESGLGGAIRTLNSAFDGFLLRIGERLEGSPIKGLANIFREASKGVSGEDFNPVFEAINAFESRLDTVFQNIATSLPEAFKNINFKDVIDSFENLTGSIADSLSTAFGGIDINTTEGLTKAIQIVINSLDSMIKITDGIIQSWEPLIGLISDMVTSFNGLDDSTKELIGKFLGFSQQAAPVIAVFVGIGAAIAGLGAIFSGAIGAITSAGGALAAIGVALAGPAGIVIAVGAAAVAFGTLLNKLDSIKISAQFVIKTLDKVFNFTGGKTKAELAEIDKNFENAKLQAKALREEAEKINETDVKPKITWADIVEAGKSTKELADELQRASDHQSITTKVKTKTEEAKQQLEEFFYWVDGKQYKMTVPVEANTKPAEKSIKDLSEKGELTKFKIEADLDKTKIEEDTKRLAIEAERVQESFKYQAEVKIEQAKVAGEILTKTFETVENSIAATGDNIVDLIGQLEGADYQTRQEIQKQVDLREKIEAERLEMEKKLLEAQLKILESQAEFYDKGGEMTLKVEGTGKVQEAAELMWEYIYEFTQAKLVAQGFNLPLLPA